MTDEEAWAEFQLAIPAKIAPARRCGNCRHRVPEEYAIFHAEERLQLRDTFFDILRRSRLPASETP